MTLDVASLLYVSTDHLRENDTLSRVVRKLDVRVAEVVNRTLSVLESLNRSIPDVVCLAVSCRTFLLCYTFVRVRNVLVNCAELATVVVSCPDDSLRVNNLRSEHSIVRSDERVSIVVCLRLDLEGNDVVLAVALLACLALVVSFRTVCEQRERILNLQTYCNDATIVLEELSAVVILLRRSDSAEVFHSSTSSDLNLTACPALDVSPCRCRCRWVQVVVNRPSRTIYIL